MQVQYELWNINFCYTSLYAQISYLKRYRTSEGKIKWDSVWVLPCWTAMRESDLWLKRVENQVFCVCVNPALVKLVSSVYVDQRLSYHAKAPGETRQAKLSVILIHWTKYQSASMTNKWSPTLKMCAALLLNPNKSKIMVDFVEAVQYRGIFMWQWTS